MKSGDGIRRKGSKWTARYTDVHGKRHEVTLEAATRKEARLKRAAIVTLVSDRLKGIGQGNVEVTFRDVWKLYKPVAETLGGWRTIDSHWRLHLEPAFGDKKLHHVSKNDVLRFLAAKAKTLSPRTCDHLRIRLGAIINFASDEKVFHGDNVASEVKPISVPEPEPRALPFEIVQAVVDSVRAEWRNFFAFAVYTGLRSGELRALKPDSVSADWRELRVSRSGTRATTKTGRNRCVHIPSAMLPYLKSALEAAKGREWLFADGEDRQLPAYIRPADILRESLEHLGLVRSWTANCTQKCKARETLLARAEWRCPKCGRAGRVRPDSPFVFHDLRKTWETYMHDAVNDPMSVFQMAGHSPEVAMKRYVAQNAKRLGEKADQLDFKRASPSLPRAATEVVENGSSATLGNVLVTGVFGGQRE